MSRYYAIVIAVLLVAEPAVAIESFPASFKAQDIVTNGTTLHVRVGGSGPAVLLLHGFGDTGDMWAPLAAKLIPGHTVIVPDLRGMGLSAHPERIDEATRAHYAALYARPHAMHDALEQFAAFPQDGVDNRAFLAKGKLTMPVLALGGEKSYGAGMAAEIGAVTSNVKGGVIPEAGHWVMEENPGATTKLVTDFLAK